MSKDLELVFFNSLNEKQKRLFAGLKATSLGYHGVSSVSRHLGLHAHTIRLGQKELLESEHLPSNSIRESGGGRKKKSKPPLK